LNPIAVSRKNPTEKSLLSREETSNESLSHVQHQINLEASRTREISRLSQLSGLHDGYVFSELPWDAIPVAPLRSASVLSVDLKDECFLADSRGGEGPVQRINAV